MDRLDILVRRRHAEKARQASEARRLRAVELFECGLSKSEIARQLGVCRQAVIRWIEAWQQGGADALKLGLPGPAPRLTSEQLQEFVGWLQEGPQAHGYDTPLWTLERMADLLVRKTGVLYHPGHVWQLLKQLGWSCQKPVRRAKQRDEKAIRRWLEHQWPAVKKGPQSEEPS